MTGWESAADWWIRLVLDDPIFASDVLPLVDWATGDRRGLWLDVGCGTGRGMHALAGDWIGCDGSATLLAQAEAGLRLVQCALPDLSWLRAGVLSGALAVLVLEHVESLDELFAELHRVVAPGGTLATVMNHPAFTAEGAGPVVDLDDGEVLWRWGRYFEPHTVTLSGTRDVVFHHRPLDAIITTAADAGWALAAMREAGLSQEATSAVPGYAGQEALPRLVGLRWNRV